jgi:antitoxin component YwqK of YwqJK toxin-antitoxin module
MLRISAILLFTFFCVAAFAQDTLNVIDGKGQRQGYWRKLDSAGQVIYTGHFRDGIPVGEFRYYYPDGKLKTVSILSNKGKRAVTTSYFQNGRKMAAGNYLNEKKDSIWRFFSEFDSAVVSQESYVAGLIHGTSKVFFPEGGLSEVYHYVNGTRDGAWERYFPDGKLKLRGSYKAGEKAGRFQIFDDSGKTRLSGQYSQGHQDGTWTYFDEKGEVFKKEFFNLGKLVKVDPPEK